MFTSPRSRLFFASVELRDTKGVSTFFYTTELSGTFVLIQMIRCARELDAFSFALSASFLRKRERERKSELQYFRLLF